MADTLADLLQPLAEPVEYLVVAPHPDDAELGVGGTIVSLLQEGAKVGVLDLTSGEPTPFGSPEIRRRETKAATAVLGLSWRGNLGLPNRSLEHTLEARAKLASAFRLLRPRIIFAPYWEDSHPDHVAASSLVDAARFWSKLSKTDMSGNPHFPPKIIYYFTVHLRIHPPTSMVLDISSNIEKKMDAIACYHSQFIEGRPTTRPTALDDVRDRARYWGWSIGTHFGEPFVCREPVGLRSLRDLT
ncbi:bacillithiol biosynthesis deacetylase BshB1 [soil metagenome]